MEMLLRGIDRLMGKGSASSRYPYSRTMIDVRREMDPRLALQLQAVRKKTGSTTTSSSTPKDPQHNNS